MPKQPRKPGAALTRKANLVLLGGVTARRRCMLYNDDEIAVMATAIQVNMRNPAIAVKPYEAIVAGNYRRVYIKR
jgi:hypothetical protein